MSAAVVDGGEPAHIDPVPKPVGFDPTLKLDDEPKEALLPKAKAVLAQLNGDLSLPCLGAPVDILRDRWGIAHIYAKNTDDLFFAQGFVAAQDRLFQMDMWR